MKATLLKYYVGGKTFLRDANLLNKMSDAGKGEDVADPPLTATEIPRQHPMSIIGNRKRITITSGCTPYSTHKVSMKTATILYTYSGLIITITIIIPLLVKLKYTIFAEKWDFFKFFLILIRYT